MSRSNKALLAALGAAGLMPPAPSAGAAEVNLVGVFTDKALVEIDGGRPQVLGLGKRTPEGVTLISTGSGTAVFEIDGRRVSLAMGQSLGRGAAAGQKATVTLYADSNGHFVTAGSINGSPVRFLVDTGATAVAMSTAEARRLGINYLNGQPARAATAGGVVPAYKVSLDAVRVGEITLNQVDATVIDAPGMPFVLLGMSYLSRLSMRRHGVVMTLVREY